MAIDPNVPAIANAVTGMAVFIQNTIGDLANFSAGAANGGPNGDGYFPLTSSTGVTRLVLSPDALNARTFGPMSQATVLREDVANAKAIVLTQANTVALNLTYVLANTAAAVGSAQTSATWAANALAQAGLALTYRNTAQAASNTAVAANATVAVNLATSQSILSQTLTANTIIQQAKADAVVAAAQANAAAASVSPSAIHGAISSNVATLNASINGKLDTSAFTWSGLTGKPTTFTPSAHTHAISEVANLQTTLDGKLGVYQGIATSYAAFRINALNMDMTQGDGLVNIVGNGDHAHMSNASTTGYRAQITGRGSSRIGLHDSTINFYTASADTLTAGDPITWVQTLSMNRNAAQFLVQPQFNGVNLITSNDMASSLSAKANKAGDTFTGNVTFPAGVMVGSGVPTGLYGDGGNVALRGYATGSLYLQTQAGVVTNLLLEPTKNTVWKPTTFVDAATFSSTVSIAGATTVTGAANLQGGATVTGNLSATGSLFVGNGGGMFVSGQNHRLMFDGSGGTRFTYRSDHASAVGMNLLTSDGNLRGVLYSDGSGTNIGFLSPAQVWRLRVDASNLYVGDSQWTAWHTGNLSPATNNTGQVFPNSIVKEFQTKAGDVLGSSAGQSYSGALGVIGPGSTDSHNQALMSFHRPGNFAAHFGLNSSNRWVVGGWSYGNGVQHQLWLNGQIPTGVWQRTDDGVGRFHFMSGSDTLYGTANGHAWRNGADATVMSLTGGGQLTTSQNVRAQNTNGTGQFTAVSPNGSTMFGFYNDGTQAYLLKHASSSTGYDAHRPFYVNLSGGGVTLDGTGAGGVTTGGTLTVNGVLYAQSEIITPGWIRVNGSNGIYWQTHGAGWYASDTTYIRSYNDRTIYSGGGFLGGAIQGSTVTATSDAKFKSRIRQLEPVAGLVPKRFIKDGKERLGYIAQDVQAVVPEAVHYQFGPNGEHSLSLEPLAMIAAVHAQLEARIAALEAR